jgi:hypothetical protein
MLTAVGFSLATLAEFERFAREQLQKAHGISLADLSDRDEGQVM